MSTLGVLVFSVCGMKHLPQCLESVEWADAVSVLHVGQGEPALGSHRSVPAVIRKVHSAAEMKEIYWEIKTDWVLRLWGEERVAAELKEQLRVVSGSGPQRSALEYRIPIRSRLLGRWVQGSLWGPSPAIRLGRSVADLSPQWWNGRGKMLGEAAESLRGWIEDYTLDDLGEGFDRIHSMARLWADRLNNEGWIPSPASMVLRPLRVFFGLLWTNGLLSHGLAGLTLSTLAAYTTLLSGAQVWEIRNVSSKKKSQE